MDRDQPLASIPCADGLDHARVCGYRRPDGIRGGWARAVRHGANFLYRVLQGKQPKDIPIEQPTKFELAINLKSSAT